LIIIIDNNIVLDALLGRYPFYETAEKILTACVDMHKGCLTMNSLTDIFYVLRKYMNATSAKEAINKLMELLEIITVNADDCIEALALPIDDFEDALLAICGKKVEADYIVTRDEKFINTNTIIPTISVSELLSIM